ncbi:MAG: alpha/beta hydrolase, partial [Opitutaceae bacterium]
MKTPRLWLASALSSALLLPALSAASAPPSIPGPAYLMFAEYFRAETARLAGASLADIRTLEDWKARRATYREQLLEMLGLSPLPERTDLKPVVTGRVEHAEFTVEKLHFQSLPGLYVTANLYVPRTLGGKKAPAILYACGHALVKDGETVLGNKTGYQHHGAWFARHGYVCLAIDTIQLGELEGVHHGTRRFGMYWWNSRGYTPAGVEAWNGMRAIDYLQSRPEVDPERIGMTGRSGGGAYTWYTAALDERIRVAVPVAGITDLHNHVVDGVVKGHCDCMYLVNTHRWDYGHLAALLAPRPLLIANSDKDPIFPLDGVIRVHSAAARIYALHKTSDRLGLLITEGPHKDTQDLQVPAFRWFNRFLKREEPLITTAAEKLFEPRDLRVFAPGTKPTDERTTKIHETFVAAAHPALPADNVTWTTARDGWRHDLRAKSFAGWPASEEPLRLSKTGGDTSGSRWEFTTQGPVRLPLLVRPPTGGGHPTEVILRVVDRDEPLPTAPAGAAVVTFLPRGLGPKAS